jgi:L-asparaginase
MFVDEPLFSLWRGGAEEVSIRGEVVICDAKKNLFQSGDRGVGTYPARSLLKPFQFLAAALPFEMWRLPSTQNRFAACMGSVSATQKQVEQLRLWYDDSALQSLIPFLKFNANYPMDETHRVLLKQAGISPQPVFHTCFSKHMAILQSCQNSGWPLDTYYERSHPYHQRLLKLLSELLAEELDLVDCVEDGCMLPTPVLKITQMATLYQKLASADEPTPLAAIRQLMVNNPEWIGGPHRIDTQLMNANRGKIVAKEGADGLLAVGVLPTPQFKSGLGLILKLSPGYLPAMAGIALAPALEALGLNGVFQVPRGHHVVFAKKIIL